MDHRNTHDHGCGCVFSGAGEPGSETFKSRADSYLLLEVAPAVREYGFKVEAVADPQGGAKAMHRSFVYTVGLSERQWPELVLGGYYPPIAAEVLGKVTQQVLAAQRRPRPGQRYTVPTGHETAYVRLAPPRPMQQQREGPLSWAIGYAGRKVRELVVRVQGWPCPRCAPCDRTVAECTCTFDCRWMYCPRFVPETETAQVGS